MILPQLETLLHHFGSKFFIFHQNMIEIDGRHIEIFEFLRQLPFSLLTDSSKSSIFREMVTNCFFFSLQTTFGKIKMVQSRVKEIFSFGLVLPCSVHFWYCYSCVTKLCLQVYSLVLFFFFSMLQIVKKLLNLLLFNFICKSDKFI